MPKSKKHHNEMRQKIMNVQKRVYSFEGSNELKSKILDSLDTYQLTDSPLTTHDYLQLLEMCCEEYSKKETEVEELTRDIDYLKDVSEELKDKLK